MRRVTWDPFKAEENFRRHRIEFTEAATLFYTTLARLDADDAHSIDEQRHRTIGWSKWGNLLVVTSVDVGSTIRIISARRATKRERHDFESG